MSYYGYIHSEKWRKKRNLVYERALRNAGSTNPFGICEKCSLEPDTDCLQVHHLTYERLYNERLEDLILLCDSCHRAEHQKQNLNEEVKDMNNEKANLEFNIVKNIGTITPGATKYFRKDLTLTSWRGKPAVYDLRTWKIQEDDSLIPYKGLTLTIDEMRELAAVLNKFFVDYAEEIKRETVRSSAKLDGFLGYVAE